MLTSNKEFNVEKNSSFKFALIKNVHLGLNFVINFKLFLEELVWVICIHFFLGFVFIVITLYRIQTRNKRYLNFILFYRIENLNVLLIFINQFMRSKVIKIWAS